MQEINITDCKEFLRHSVPGIAGLFSQISYHSLYSIIQLNFYQSSDFRSSNSLKKLCFLKSVEYFCNAIHIRQNKKHCLFNEQILWIPDSSKNLAQMIRTRFKWINIKIRIIVILRLRVK